MDNGSDFYILFISHESPNFLKHWVHATQGIQKQKPCVRSGELDEKKSTAILKGFY